MPPHEARALLSGVSGRAREDLIAHPEREVDRLLQAQFDQFVQRRLTGEPLAYLLGEKEFYGRMFAVTRDVLIPRPETELLVDAARAALHQRHTPHILDLGTGSGCIAVTLALEMPTALVTAVDASAAAVAVAQTNAARLGARVDFMRGDWFSAVTGTFDLIVSNPPYIAAGDPHLEALRFEPRGALTADDDGLTCLRHIVQTAPSFLAPEGWLIVEHGYDQGKVVRRLLDDAGFVEIQTRQDFAEIERVSAGKRSTS